MDGTIVRLDVISLPFKMEITLMTFPGQPILILYGDHTDVVLLSLILHQYFTILSSLACLGSYYFHTFSNWLFTGDQSKACISSPCSSSNLEQSSFRLGANINMISLSLGKVCILVYKHCWPVKDTPSYSKVMCTVYSISPLSLQQLVPYSMECILRRLNCRFPAKKIALTALPRGLQRDAVCLG
jgi:hypothetical protein